MTINFGKREAGALTAASPGDTLYIPLQFYNDSGASISIGSTLAVTDIEVFKNGGVAQRATDSGFAILGDTGNFDNRTGFKGISIRLFNTADDANFYEPGATYWVAIDSVTIDARTVRFFPAVFEIGRQKVNAVEIDGDTGPADNLGRIVGDTGQGSYLYRHRDTGGIADAVWGKDSKTLTAFQFDTGVWGSNAARTLTTFNHDTGVADTVWKYGDTGLRKVHTTLFTDSGLYDTLSDMDTGLNDRLGRILADTDTGLRAQISDLDTGLHDHINDLDTGLRDYVDNTDTGIKSRFDNLATEAGGVTVTRFSDTGINNRLDKIFADTDTGLRKQISDLDTGVMVILDKLQFDTGANELHADIRKVNNVQVQGAGANNNKWRPV